MNFPASPTPLSLPLPHSLSRRIILQPLRISPTGPQVGGPPVCSARNGPGNLAVSCCHWNECCNEKNSHCWNSQRAIVIKAIAMKTSSVAAFPRPQECELRLRRKTDKAGRSGVFECFHSLFVVGVGEGEPRVKNVVSGDGEQEQLGRQWAGGNCLCCLLRCQFLQDPGERRGGEARLLSA